MMCKDLARRQEASANDQTTHLGLNLDLHVPGHEKITALGLAQPHSLPDLLVLGLFVPLGLAKVALANLRKCVAVVGKVPVGWRRNKKRGRGVKTERRGCSHPNGCEGGRAGAPKIVDIVAGAGERQAYVVLVDGAPAHRVVGRTADGGAHAPVVLRRDLDLRDGIQLHVVSDPLAQDLDIYIYGAGEMRCT